ncbi:hypothetical protein [Sphingobium sp. MK2]|uniref:hypothetical protein n=1 Tax=Sphingobium sp. MK2 TaxID=3116540 RepID=UPI0032E363CB
MTGTMWDKVQEANELRAKLGETPWLYLGDASIREGGLAVTVDRTFGFATIVEATDLDSATGCAGAVLLQRGTVILDRLNLRQRRNLRSAMQTVDQTMAALRAEYQGDEKWKRMALLAYAKWIYGERDEDSPRVLVHDREAFDEACETGRFEGWQQDAEDCDSVRETFMEELYS